MLGYGQTCRGPGQMSVTPVESSATAGPPELNSLLTRVRAGDEAAVREMIDVYGPTILRAVRMGLPAKLRSKFDSVDFVQDVWGSFFANLPQGSAFREPQDLVAFLTR